MVIAINNGPLMVMNGYVMLRNCCLLLSFFFRKTTWQRSNSQAVRDHDVTHLGPRSPWLVTHRYTWLSVAGWLYRAQLRLIVAGRTDVPSAGSAYIPRYFEVWDPNVISRLWMIHVGEKSTIVGAIIAGLWAVLPAITFTTNHLEPLLCWLSGNFINIYQT